MWRRYSRLDVTTLASLHLIKRSSQSPPILIVVMLKTTIVIFSASLNKHQKLSLFFFCFLFFFFLLFRSIVACFSFSADSSRDLMTWLDHLNEVIRNALSCNEVAQRLWSSPWNKVCADCGSPNPEWASINLLMVICEACAGEEISPVEFMFL